MPVVGSAALPPQFDPPSSPGTLIWSRVSVCGVNRPSLRAFVTISRRRCCSASSRCGLMSSGRERQPRERRRLGREGLRRPGFLARNVALRHRPLFDRPQRLAGHAIEHVEQSELRRLRDDVARLAVVPHGEQLRRGGQVVVPDVVVHGLEVPEALAGARVEREQRVAEEVGALAIAAEHVVGRRAEREVGDPAPLVDRDLAPRVHAAGPLPCALGPGVVAELARVRDRVEGPHQLAGDDVVRREGRRAASRSLRRCWSR